MSEKNNDKWLDEIIFEMISTDRPRFDVEKFKQKFPNEFKMLQSRATKQSSSYFQWTDIFKESITKFAAAAVLIIGLVIGALMGRDTLNNSGTISAGKSQMTQAEPTAIYNLDYLKAAPKGSLADIYLTLVSITNGKER